MKIHKPVVLVTGSKGQVGQELQVLAGRYRGFRFIFADVDELDITDSEAVSVFFKNNEIHYCLNCAAYTAVDRAESDVETARKVNVAGAENLAKNCAANEAKLVQLSTDYVYHTGQNTPFTETDSTCPKGVYAQTKLDGDLSALAHGGVVVRTSWVYSSFGHNFVKTMLKLGAERRELRVVFDQIGTPTYAADLASALLEMLQKVENQELDRSVLTGIYHYSNEGVTSWYDFAKAIFDIRKMNVRVLPIETSDYPTPAKRPPFSVLNKAKIKATFGLEIPHWRESLKVCLRLLKNQGTIFFP
jgi:dTDP-4-dehydrorhamnose reductase